LIKQGDIVELLPTNNRNRQLRTQEKKIAWTVIVPAAWPQCFGGKEGILIESHKDRKHSRWVEPKDITLLEYAENGFRE
tara:strand:- start:14585 stop:14821 length:237 start_codon:yes stop_codon:yes gene_type:complete